MAIGTIQSLVENGKPTLRAAYATLALNLQEAAGDLSNNDVARRLGDAVRQAHKGSDQPWAYYLDHFGDADGGDVIYSCGSAMKRAPYSVAAGGDGDSAAVYSIDTDNAQPVTPRTIYESQPDEDDHYARMEEAFRAETIYTDLPLYERFISKSERSSMDAGDFAGKGKSFPISSPQDVAAAAHAMGRAGAGNYGMSTLKANIIRIAKRKGWTKYLPKAWQDGGASTDSTATPTAQKESGDLIIHHADRQLILIESASTIDVIELREGSASSTKSDYEIKLIGPGAGTTAYYPADILQRDGPKVFKEGTKVFLNHQTPQEQAARPEGDVNNLAGVLATDAEWKESHAKGPGLYARMKVFADHAATVAEKAKHIGMSIRAYGSQAVQEGRKLMKEGLPVLGSFRGSRSVDIVAQAGAGGMILTEAAKAKKMATKECANCKGTGDCPGCKGAGSVMAEAAAKTKTECTDCQGSGECAMCEGNGKLMESAAPNQSIEEKEMDAKEVKELIEAAVNPLKTDLATTKLELTEAKTKLASNELHNGALLDRALRGDAREAATEVLSSLPLRESAKQYILNESLKNIPAKDGQLDEVVFKEAVKARAKDVAAAIGTPGVIGMGGAPVEIDSKEAAAAIERNKKVQAASVDVFTELMGDSKAAEFAAGKGQAA